ncbi:hypothetical protein A3842_10415 [Paenibacillus sp. P3E]|uniref:hypothetical protein n=1 Tax=Paenibacillus sp. P3E TaxID=1349435 RepID=UPI00093E6CEA|nr:hypothetical protein [Paenibacillus sp. P3E]OKP82423.1 hypothetical protein A3842_10415 [Paenibacillus sp. P3E]
MDMTCQLSLGNYALATSNGSEVTEAVNEQGIPTGERHAQNLYELLRDMWQPFELCSLKMEIHHWGFLD